MDAVFEFPALYALQSADRFSCHAASMLHAMGVNMIAFGAESLTKDELISAACWAISEDYEHLLHERIADGLSYGEAAHEAMAAAFPYLADELTKPNNLLGFRYTETILRKHYDMDILVIPRDMEHPVSATSARRELLSQKGRHFFLLRTQSKPPSSWKKATTRIPPAMKTAATFSPA